MKKLIAFCFFVFFAIAGNAQWYYNSFNVTNINELNQDQLNLALQKAERSIKTGKTLTFVGLGIGVVGAILYSSGLSGIVNDDISNLGSNTNKGVAGAYIMCGGFGMAGIGIPVWVSGARRKDDIEIALVKFKPQGSASINGIGLIIRF